MSTGCAAALLPPACPSLSCDPVHHTAATDHTYSTPTQQENIMAKVTFKGSPVQLRGQFPSTGSQAPEFSLCDSDLNDKSLASFARRRKQLHLFPHMDIEADQTSVR